MCEDGKSRRGEEWEWSVYYLVVVAVITITKSSVAEQRGWGGPDKILHAEQHLSQAPTRPR